MTETTAGRFEQAGWLVAEVGHRRDYWAARRHPFHERWFAGELEAWELQAYAEEHHHVVVTLAEVAQRAATLADGMLGEQLGRVADARERDVELWCAFASATGWSESISWYYAAEPLPETEAGVRIWAGDAERSLEAHLVTLYALETAQAEVARPQLEALVGRYGFPDDDRTRYFRRRCLGDEGPAGLIEAALTGRLPVADPFALARHAELTCRAYWELLDGVDRFTRAPRPWHAPRASGAPRPPRAAR
jgi:pyrroloquinoline quinone (PQQ) biosynthesis protein C